MSPNGPLAATSANNYHTVVTKAIKPVAEAPDGQRSTCRAARVMHNATVMHGDATALRARALHEHGGKCFARFEHNLGIHSQPHFLVLSDDDNPVCFWMPGFQGYRSNLAANRRVMYQAGLTFFNNSAHARGIGWHPKPPHGPQGPRLFA